MAMRADAGFVAVVWDVENVTPRADGGTVEAIVELAQNYGKLSVAMAFADWTKRQVSKIDGLIAAASFQLIHVPKSTKNSADVSMITHAVESLFLYPHITTYVLVTGDADFRPLLQAIRRRGGTSVVICDSRNANEELLVLADDYRDFRDLEFAEASDDQDEDAGPTENLSEQEAYALLSETVSRMTTDGKQTVLGPVKVRMKLLNPHFDETSLGFPNWKRFVLSAQKFGAIDTQPVDGDLRIVLPSTKPSEDTVPEQFSQLRETMEALSKNQTADKLLFTEINKHLKSKGVDYRKLGYRKFSELMQDAEKRELITISKEGLDRSATLID